MINYSALVVVGAATGTVLPIFDTDAAHASVPWTHPFLQRRTIPADGDYNNYAVWRQEAGYGHHSGIDLNGTFGMAIYNCAPGTVTWAGLGNGNASWGYWVEVLHSDGTKTAYSHLKAGSITVTAGKPLAGPTKIGEVGGTGSNGVVAYPAHLHLTRYVGTISNRSDPTFLAYATIPVPVADVDESIERRRRGTWHG